MKVIKNETTVFFDVDETLIIHNRDKSTSESFCSYILDPDTNKYHHVAKHEVHIDYLIKSKARGRFVVVWSANGYRWAEAVIKKLKLTKYVDLIMTKPGVYFDDVDANAFMQRVYIKLEGK